VLGQRLQAKGQRPKANGDKRQRPKPIHPHRKKKGQKKRKRTGCRSNIARIPAAPLRHGISGQLKRAHFFLPTSWPARVVQVNCDADGLRLQLRSQLRRSAETSRE
jgi:hypothetical protein